MEKRTSDQIRAELWTAEQRAQDLVGKITRLALERSALERERKALVGNDFYRYDGTIPQLRMELEEAIRAEETAKLRPVRVVNDVRSVKVCGFVKRTQKRIYLREMNGRRDIYSDLSGQTQWYGTIHPDDLKWILAEAGKR